MSIIVKQDNSIKVVLDSNNTTSFSGRQFDAVYTLDFNRIVMKQEDFDRPYLVTFYFRTAESAHATNTLTGNDTYQVALDFGKGLNTVYDRNQYNVVGLLGLSEGITTANASFAYSTESDNFPFVVKNLRNVNSCRLTVLKSSNNTVFNAADNATINNATKYVCVVTLKAI